jgi:hypothetical protein
MSEIQCSMCRSQNSDEFWKKNISNGGSRPKCSFSSGVFSEEGWNCGAANFLREAAELAIESGEGMRCRRDDQSYAALWIPDHPNDCSRGGEELGEFRGGGFVAMTWYKERGQVDMIARIDAWDSEKKCNTVRPITLTEAEAAIENIRVNQGTTKNRRLV